MESRDKQNFTNTNTQNQVKHPESFTIAEFIARERANEPKGKKYLFYLLIVLTLLWGLVRLPYTLFIYLRKSGIQILSKITSTVVALFSTNKGTIFRNRSS
jgi:hypothetical protein